MFVPVVLGVGTTLVFQLLPYVTDADDRAAAGPSTSASASPTTGVADPGGASGTPSERASASTSPSASSRPPGKASRDNGTDDAGTGPGGSGAKDTDTGSGSGSGGGSEAETSGGSTGSTSAGSSGNGSGGTSGGSSGSTSGGSTGGNAATGPTLQNASTSNCLTATASYVVRAGSCSGTGTAWSFRPVSGGVQIVSQANGQCLASYGNVHTAPCGTDSTQVWTRRSDGTLRVNRTGECLGLNGSLVLHQTCNGSATQRWR